MPVQMDIKKYYKTKQSLTHVLYAFQLVECASRLACTTQEEYIKGMGCNMTGVGNIIAGIKKQLHSMGCFLSGIGIHLKGIGDFATTIGR